MFRLETKQQKINELEERLAISEKQLAFVHHSLSVSMTDLS